MAGAILMLAGVFASGPLFWIMTRILVQRQFSDVDLATAENWGSAANLLVAIVLATARRRGWMSWTSTSSMMVFLVVYAVLLVGAAAGLFDARSFLVFGSVSRISFVPLTVLVAAEGFGHAGLAATVASLMFLAGAAALQPVAAGLAQSDPGLGYAAGAATTVAAVVGTLLVKRFGVATGTEGEHAEGVPTRAVFGLLVGCYLLLQVGYFARDTFAVSICALMGVDGDGIGWWSSASTIGEAAVAVAFLLWPLASASWSVWLASRGHRLAHWAALGAFAAFSAALAFTALGAGHQPVPLLFGVRGVVEGPSAALVERVAEGYIYAVFGQLNHAQSPALIFDAIARLIPILGRALLYLGWSVRQAYLGTAVIGVAGLLLAYAGRSHLAHFFIEVLGGGFRTVRIPPQVVKGNMSIPATQRAWLNRRARRSGVRQHPVAMTRQRTR
ncbi:hypothetical protein CVO96_17010 [Deinococcus koreensis]|uniref:Uncharacterized protein n=2 Tax=Deinococcus koreensis TaxID=2054903 RepID=A0A2K3USZ9_9DEIO|nr:hypothetical protein CVO96_17010 [Deinococcus koreensis]